MSGQVVTIEDDDGFTTEWPWPKDRLGLANAEFIEMCEQMHDAARADHEGKELP